MLARWFCRALTSTLTSNQTIQGARVGCIRVGASSDQIRSYRKRRNVQYYYGRAPLLSEEKFFEAKDEGKLVELSFEKVRFAHIWESNSPLYDETYEKFVNFLLRDGRKELFYDLMHRTLYLIKCYQMRRLSKEASKENKKADGEPNDVELNPITVFKQAIENSKPLVITKKVKRGGAIYQVPYPLLDKQGEYIAIKWILSSVADRPKPKKRKFYEAMASELIDAANGVGKVIKKRDDIHRLADANRAYAHYRWS